MLSAGSGVSTSFLKSTSGSRIEDGCDALFFIAIFGNCCFRVIIKVSVFLVFFIIMRIKEICFSY